MNAAVLESNSALNEQNLKSKRMVFEVEITADATPADKVHGVDVPSVVILRSEGKVAQADAIEDLSGSFTTAVDDSTGDSQFGILITELGSIEKVYSVTVSEQTSLASSLSVALLGTNGLTAGGNIGIDIAGTGLDLSTESPVLLIEVEYLKSI